VNAVKGFVFNAPTTVVFGSGSIAGLVDQVRRLGCGKPLILTGPRIGTSGLLDKLKEPFGRAGLDFRLFDGVVPEPPAEKVYEAAMEVRREGYDLLVGVGGGSTMDFTKIVSVLASHDLQIEEMAGNDKIPSKGLPTIMVPTTSGSGSEVSPVAVLSFPEQGMKRGIASRCLIPDAAIVDPELTLGLPPEITANTGVDALIHGIESFLSVKANPLSQNLSLMACENICKNLARVVLFGSDLEAREGMSLGSLTAGLAFSMAGTAAVHALAYPLGGQYHVPHGAANAVMLKPVLDFNRPSCLEGFQRLAMAFGVAEPQDPNASADAFIDTVRTLCERTGVKTRLRDLGIPEESIGGMAEAAMRETRLLENNPRPVGKEDAERLYREAW
jgi:alcohol dehydrogenase class IV